MDQISCLRTRSANFAVRKAQDRLARCHLWDKQTIKTSLQELLAREGYLNQKLTNHFGSLFLAYEEVGYKPPPVSPFGNNGKHWSKKSILIGLRKLYAANGYITNRLIVQCSYLPSNNHIRRHFGCLQKALKEAGLPVSTHGEAQRRGWERRKAAGCDEYYRGVRWTDAKLFRALRLLERSNGYISANLLDQNGDTPSTHYYAKRFGSLTKARELAKLPTRTDSEITLAACKRRIEGTLIRRRHRPPGQPPILRYRSDDILRGLRRLASQHGRVSISLIEDDPTMPSAATLIHRFGSISRAYRLAGLVRLAGWPMRHGLPGNY